MAEVINLRQKRKAKARSEKEKKAEENRRVHGRTKAEKQQKKKEDDLASRRLDGHKRTPAESDTDSD